MPRGGRVPGRPPRRVPVTDTIKRVEEGLVVDTVDRAALYGGADPPGV